MPARPGYVCSRRDVCGDRNSLNSVTCVACSRPLISSRKIAHTARDIRDIDRKHLRECERLKTGVHKQHPDGSLVHPDGLFVLFKYSEGWSVVFHVKQGSPGRDRSVTQVTIRPLGTYSRSNSRAAPGCHQECMQDTNGAGCAGELALASPSLIAQKFSDYLDKPLPGISSSCKYSPESCCYCVCTYFAS